MFSQILHLADRNLIRIIKADKDFTKWYDFKDIKLRKLKKRIPSAVVLFWLCRQGKTSNLCIWKCFEEKHVDLLLSREEGKRHYVLIKDFNTFMYNHTLHHGRKTFLPLLFTGFQ